MKAAVVKCDPLKYLYENSLHKKELQQNICFKLQKVIFGKSNPAYNICLGFYYKFILATFIAKCKLIGCESKKHVTSLLSSTQKNVLWDIHWGIKVA